MRLLSPHAAYSIQVIEGNEQVVVDARGYAQTVVIGKPVICNFDQGGLLDHEIEAALERFTFSGIPEGVNPLTTIGVFDTEGQGYSDELFVKVNERFEQLQKQHPNDFIIVPMPRAEKPWPNYDDDNAADIIKLQERLGIKPEKIRRYEVENANRYEVVHAMLALDDPEGAAKMEAEREAPKAKAAPKPKAKPVEVDPSFTDFPSAEAAGDGMTDVVVDG